MIDPWIGLADLVSGNGLAYAEEVAPFTLTDFEKLMERMCPVVRTEFDAIFTSPAIMRRMLHLERLESLYTATALPKRKLRKCIERKVLSRRKQGRLRIARLERAEAQRLRGIQHPQCRCAIDEPLDLAVQLSSERG